MNDDFTFLIFTYHNVFHSLLASFRLRKWRLLALVSSDVDVTCVLSFRSAFPTQRRWVMMKTNFQPKIGLKQPNVLTQRCQPSIWVEKITQRFLECRLSDGQMLPGHSAKFLIFLSNFFFNKAIHMKMCYTLVDVCALFTSLECKIFVALLLYSTDTYSVLSQECTKKYKVTTWT